MKLEIKICYQFILLVQNIGDVKRSIYCQETPNVHVNSLNVRIKSTIQNPAVNFHEDCTNFPSVKIVQTGRNFGEV